MSVLAHTYELYLCLINRLSPNLKEAWINFTVKKLFVQLAVNTFIHWLQDLAEAHERTQVPHNLYSEPIN